MKTEFVYLQGKVKWFRAQQPDEYGKWKHVLYPNAESLEKIRDLQLSQDGVTGIKNVLKKDEDGYSMTFSRPASKEIRGKIVGFAPPDVFESDGKTPMRNVNVGNGSDVTTKIAVYSHGTPGGGRAKAARWESSRIDNLVPYNPPRDYTDSEEKSARGLSDQPAQF